MSAYKVTLAAIPMVRREHMPNPPFIPGTDQEVVLMTNEGMGREIWYGYLGMREEQKKKAPPQNAWFCIKQPETADEVSKFREAIDIFNWFLADGRRDNCLAVKDIVAV